MISERGANLSEAQGDPLQNRKSHWVLPTFFLTGLILTKNIFKNNIFKPSGWSTFRGPKVTPTKTEKFNESDPLFFETGTI